jgi:hypothetical protein
MSDEKRKINIIKQGKKYLGELPIPSDKYRTTDFFNRPSILRHRADQGTLDSYIPLYDAEVTIDDNFALKRQNVINIRIIDIIFYWDELENVGTPAEQKKAKAMMDNAGQPELNRINVITPMYGDQFYEISGNFFGYFKRAMTKNFLSLTNATIDHFFKTTETGKWNKKPIALPYGFAALNMNFVDSYSLESDE